jgi:3-oxoacyl-[acyl-carrier-protein] synthase II
VPVFAGKSYFGNVGAGSDLSELTISFLAFAHGQLPRTLNHEIPDPACPVRVNREPTPVGRPYVLKLGQTEMGQCAAVVCRKWD